MNVDLKISKTLVLLKLVYVHYKKFVNLMYIHIRHTVEKLLLGSMQASDRNAITPPLITSSNCNDFFESTRPDAETHHRIADR